MPDDGAWWVAPHGVTPRLERLVEDKHDHNLARLVAALRLARAEAGGDLVASGAEGAFRALIDLAPNAVTRTLSHPSFFFWLAATENLLAAAIAGVAPERYFTGPVPTGVPPLLAYLSDLNRFAVGATLLAGRPSNFPVRSMTSGDATLPGSGRYGKTAEATIGYFELAADVVFEIPKVGRGTDYIELDRFDPFFRHWAVEECFPGDRSADLAPVEALAAFSARMNAAMTLLHRARPEILAEVTYVMRSVVPLVSPDPDVNLSVSAPEFFGATMITYDATPMLAEALVHEYRHNLLNAVLETSPAFVDDHAGTRLFYSPWRDDPRPPAGLLHAVFTFIEVAETLLALVRSQILSEPNTIAAARRCLGHITRLQIAVDEFRRVSGLTAFGEQMVSGFGSSLEQLERARDGLANIAGTEIVTRVKQHAQRFRSV